MRVRRWRKSVSLWPVRSRIRRVIQKRDSPVRCPRSRRRACSLAPWQAVKKTDTRSELTGCAPGAEGWPNMKYQVVAYPVRLNQTGVRAFCSDESAVVKVDAGGSAEKCVQSGESLR